MYRLAGEAFEKANWLGVSAAQCFGRHCSQFLLSSTLVPSNKNRLKLLILVVFGGLDVL